MSIYISEINSNPNAKMIGTSKWCYLMADSWLELYELVNKLNIRRKVREFGLMRYFIIDESQRLLVLDHGAKEIGRSGIRVLSDKYARRIAR